MRSPLVAPTLILALAAAAGPAAAQYRPGMPAGNPAPPRVDPDAPNHGAAGAVEITDDRRFLFRQPDFLAGFGR